MNMITSTLWMGDLEPYMDEKFIKTAFDRAGVPILEVEIVKDKVTSSNVGYGFVTFPDPDCAQHAIVKLNGQTIPLSNPVKHFLLNPVFSTGASTQRKNDFQLFVWDLTREVSDAGLFAAFARKYPTCVTARVCVDHADRPKGYGFVTFTTEADQQKALIEMQHMTGIGRRPIRLSLIGAQRPVPFANYTQHQYYSQIYPQFQQYQYNQYIAQMEESHKEYIDFLQSQSGELNKVGWAKYYDPMFDELPELPDHDLDVESINEHFFKETEEVFEAIEQANWSPIDNVFAKVDNS